MTEFKNLGDLIVWLGSGPGLIVTMGFVEAYILERFSFWHKWNSDLRALLVMVFAALFSWGMRELSAFPSLFTDETLNGIFNAIVFYVGSQVAYKKYFRKELDPT